MCMCDWHCGSYLFCVLKCFSVSPRLNNSEQAVLDVAEIFIHLNVSVISADKDCIQFAKG